MGLAVVRVVMVPVVLHAGDAGERDMWTMNTVTPVMGAAEMSVTRVVVVENAPPVKDMDITDLYQT
ncbi:MAG: hypothetical protein P1Q69_03515 [Candidatus Thorarchaeota archaeon]|nr:hypothetical protein [Candidatus Thorarchaeota archaeon]